ncbi:hypothetical protein [Streptomyces sp. NPDC086776]|uniref:hypothetical protein n=1 Tax=Streptomyces sp. NPDC086776 TaxID=3365756 RepID=UPI0037F1A07C
MPEPTFIYTDTKPGTSRQNVHARVEHRTSDEHLGQVYETAGDGWVAEWFDGERAVIAMSGFRAKESAASALYWFRAPEKSDRHTQWYSETDKWVNGTVTFRGESAEAAATALNRAAGALLDGAASWTDTTATTYDVQITVANN